MENVQNLQIKLNRYISHTVSCKIIYNGDIQNHTTRLDWYLKILFGYSM